MGWRAWKISFKRSKRCADMLARPIAPAFSGWKPAWFRSSRGRWRPMTCSPRLGPEMDIKKSIRMRLAGHTARHTSKACPSMVPQVDSNTRRQQAQHRTALRHLQSCEAVDGSPGRGGGGVLRGHRERGFGRWLQKTSPKSLPRRARFRRRSPETLSGRINGGAAGSACGCLTMRAKPGGEGSETSLVAR